MTAIAIVACIALVCVSGAALYVALKVASCLPKSDPSWVETLSRNYLSAYERGYMQGRLRTPELPLPMGPSLSAPFAETLPPEQGTEVGLN